MLSFSPWKIEQTEFAASEEALCEGQLTFSNGYISQEGFFEEYYPSEHLPASYLRGIANPIPPIAGISVRLHEERFTLATWQVQEFYRCLHRDQPLLERRVIARSQAGQTLCIHSKRLLSSSQQHLMQIDYEVRSLDYSGPISFLALLGEHMEETDWYPLESYIYPDIALSCIQSKSADIQAACAMTFELFKNGEPVRDSLIRIEKRYILGYSITDSIRLGDVFLIRKRVAISDTHNYPSSDLFTTVKGYLGQSQISKPL